MNEAVNNVMHQGLDALQGEPSLHLTVGFEIVAVWLMDGR